MSKAGEQMRLSSCASALAVAVIACFLALPAGAGATVDVSAGLDGGDYVISVDGDAGVQNLAAVNTNGTITLISSNSEPMTAGSGCVAGTNQVECQIPGGDWSVVFVDVLLEAGADKFRAVQLTEDAGLSVFGGDDNDELVGSDFADLLVGEGGADQLTGRAGSDVFAGGAGNDVLNLADGEIDNPASACGDGSQDYIAMMDRNDPVNGDCEYSVPMQGGALQLTGTVAPGGLVTIPDGGFIGGPGLTYTYQWFTCPTMFLSNCVLVGNGKSYSPTQGDVGRFLSAKVTATLGLFGASAQTGTNIVRVNAASGGPKPSLALGGFKSGTSGSLTVSVPGAGRLAAGPIASGSSRARRQAKKFVKRTTKLVSRAGTTVLPIKLTSVGKKQLKKNGKLKVTITVTFTPVTGAPTSVTKSVTFKAKKKR